MKDLSLSGSFKVALVFGETNASLSKNENPDEPEPIGIASKEVKHLFLRQR